MHARAKMQEREITLDNKQKKEGASRRDFLKLAGTTAPAAVAAMAVGAGEASADELVEGTGLKKTPHVEQYLASARF